MREILLETSIETQHITSKSPHFISSKLTPETRSFSLLVWYHNGIMKVLKQQATVTNCFNSGSNLKALSIV